MKTLQTVVAQVWACQTPSANTVRCRCGLWLS